MRFRRTVTAAVLAGALALSACTASQSPQQGPAATTPAKPDGVDGRAPEQLAKGGLVRLAISSAPTQWNPLSTAGDTAGADVLRGPLSGQAFWFDASGVPRPNPDYVVSATASGSPTVVTLRLNPQAVWGDATPITAADWVATYAAYRAAQQRTTARPLPGWDRVAGVAQGGDDHEVVVTYTGADPDWTEPLIGLPARAASVADAATFDEGWSAYRADWFAGPYVIAHIDPVQQLWTLEPNPRWWGTKPLLERIFVRIVPPDALAGTVAAGEFDLYSPGRDDALLALARTAANSTVRTGPGTSGRSLTFALDGPLADRRVRQALVRGIDRTKLARAALRSVEPNPALWSNHLMAPQQAGYLDAAAATGIEYDPKAAAEALTAAGWPLVGGVRTGASGPLALTVGVPTGDARAEAEASSLVTDLGALGIAVRTVSSDADLTLAGSEIPRYPLRGVAGRFAGVDGLAELAAGMDTQLDASARLGQATQTARLLWQDARTLPLYVEPDVVVVRTRLANLGASGYASTSWADVGFTP